MNPETTTSAPKVGSSAIVRPSIGDEITFIHRADYTKTTRKRTAKVRHVYKDGKILVYLTFWQNQKGVFVMPEDVLEVRPNDVRQPPLPAGGPTNTKSAAR